MRAVLVDRYARMAAMDRLDQAGLRGADAGRGIDERNRSRDSDNPERGGAANGGKQTKLLHGHSSFSSQDDTRSILARAVI